MGCLFLSSLQALSTVSLCQFARAQVFNACPETCTARVALLEEWGFVRLALFYGWWSWNQKWFYD